MAQNPRPKTSSRQPPLALGTLYVVATPIGNLEDVTLRALRVLGEVALIAAEDTRRTTKLLRHHGIHTATTSFHAHNERQKASALLASAPPWPGRGPRHRRRYPPAIRPRGSPGTRSPSIRDSSATRTRGECNSGGTRDVRPCRRVLHGLWDSHQIGPNARIRWLRDLLSEPRTLVMFEAPHRIRVALRDMQAILGDRQIALCREITKIHEELVNGPISEVLQHLSEPRGEFTIVVSPPKNTKKTPVPPELRVLWKDFGLVTNNEALGRRSAVSKLAKRYGMTSRWVYSALEEAKAAYMAYDITISVPPQSIDLLDRLCAFCYGSQLAGPSETSLLGSVVLLR